MAREVLVWRQAVGEDETRRTGPARHRRIAQILIGIRVITQQPQHTARDRLEQSHPDIENRRRDLSTGVEAAEDEALGRQPHFLPRRCARRDAPGRVVYLIAIGQMNDFFGVVRLLIKWRDDRVGDDVVDEVGTRRTGA